MKVQEAHKQLHDQFVKAINTRNIEQIKHLCDAMEALLNDAPTEPVLLFSIGTAKLYLGHAGMAVACFERVLDKMPNEPQIWNNLGSAWKQMNQDAVAEKCWRKAVEIAPNDADYYNNLSTLYVNVGNPEEGIQYAEKALELDQNCHRAMWNYSLLLLEMGQWELGLQGYDAGLLSGDRPVRNYNNAPIWEGQKGKKVVVYGEQGMGDELMYASCLQELIDDCDTVYFDCHPRLVNLFKRSFPGLQCYPSRKDLDVSWSESLEIDYKLPIGSIFRWYRSKGKFPKTTYLKPDPERVAKYRKRLEETGPGPYVGISWKAGTPSTRNDFRTIKLTPFIPLIKAAGTVVSLQYTPNEGKEKVERFKADTGLTIHHWPEVVESGDDDGTRYDGYDYEETVALIAALDLVVVPNTTAVHLCGAIGQNCWTLTPDGPAWRYQLKGRDMPMYGPWVRQYRKRNRDWQDVIEEVAKDARSHNWTRSVHAERAAG